MKKGGKIRWRREKGKSKQSGITLIALAVTIVVLLILAAVAIGLSVGDNGIITSAKDASEKWQQGINNEQDELKQIADFINGNSNSNDNNQSDDETSSGGIWNTATTVVNAKKQNKSYEEDTTIKDELLNEIRIPAGFKVSQESADLVEDGIVIEDDNGNQFVWIPAKTGSGKTVHTTNGDKVMIYQRSSFGVDIETVYLEDLAKDEENSVNKNGGYYLGRFEAGDSISTEEKKMRTLGDSEKNKLGISKGMAPFEYISYENAKELAKNMGIVEGYSGTTKITSSYAWDTALNFIQIKVNDYASNSMQGNYNISEFQYTDITGNKLTKTKGSTQIVPTGQTTAVSNIYDMGGNCYEMTSEISYSWDEFAPIISRGGCCEDYNSTGAYHSASYRDHGGEGQAAGILSFRVAMFCKV